MPAAFAAPALPVSTDKLDDHNELPLQFERLEIDVDADLFYLGCMSEQGSFTLILSSISSSFDTSAIITRFQTLPGFSSCDRTQSPDSTELVDLHVNFSTAEDAAMALATQPPYDIGNGSRRILAYAQQDNSDPQEPAHKKLKVDSPKPIVSCQICGDSLLEAFSRPCFHCQANWCLDCLQNQFRASLSDQEQFPATCCGKILHYDVARGVVAENDLSTYRTRFEQYNTTKPVYCANMRCSAFLPTRMAKPDAQARVQCPTCSNTTCTVCKILIDDTDLETHNCVDADATIALVKQFDYKQCPKCDAGIAKMFGCNHVRCQCGAHWCWDCRRPIQICWSKPCERSQEDGDYSDGDHVSELSENESEGESVPDSTPSSVQPANQTAVALVNEADQATLQPMQEDSTHTEGNEQTPEIQTSADSGARQPRAAPEGSSEDAASPNQEPVPAAEPLVNLDAEDADDWEGRSFDFGDEPVDESFDTWGCFHHFNPVLSKIVWEQREFWLPDLPSITSSEAALTKQLDCLRCFRPVVIDQPSGTDADQAKGKQVERSDSACDVREVLAQQPATSEQSVQIMDGKVRKKRKTKKSGDKPVLYKCVKCGTFHCADCKKLASTEIRTLLEKRSDDA